MSEAYSIGYSLHRDLRGLAKRLGDGAGELAALERLHRGEGTREDVELAAGLYERGGEDSSARELRRGCYGRDPLVDLDPRLEPRRLRRTAGHDVMKELANEACREGCSPSTPGKLCAPCLARSLLQSFGNGACQ